MKFFPYRITLFLASLLLFLPDTAYPSNLEFSAEMSKESYAKADSVQISFKLENMGEEAVLVNKRFHLGSPDMSRKERDVFLDVTGPSGQRLAPKSMYAAGYPRSDFFHTLDPGKTVRSERGTNLKRFYDIQEAGSYSVTAYYDNAFGPEIGLDVFRTKLSSQTLKFEFAEQAQ